MTPALVATVLGIAVVDAVNPSALLMTSYLVTRPDPWRAVVAYIAGIFTLYLSVGLIVVFALGSAVDALVDLLSSPSVPFVLSAVVGAAALGFAARRPRKARPQPRLPAAPSPSRAFLLGMTITAVEATTAVPYLGALAAIVRTDTTAGAVVALLVAYNVVFIAPPTALAVVARLGRNRRSNRVRERKKPPPWVTTALRALCGVIGVLLVLDAGLYFIADDPLFPA